MIMWKERITQHVDFYLEQQQEHSNKKGVAVNRWNAEKKRRRTIGFSGRSTTADS